MKRAALLASLMLAACNPPPRDARWFAAHPDEAVEVAKACAAGSRSQECENARTGLSRARAKARMERYRKGFE